MVHVATKILLDCRTKVHSPLGFVVSFDLALKFILKGFDHAFCAIFLELDDGGVEYLLLLALKFNTISIHVYHNTFVPCQSTMHQSLLTLYTHIKNGSARLVVEMIKSETNYTLKGLV